MNTALKLMKKIFLMKFPWNLWVGVMAIINMIGGLYYWSLPEGKIVLGCLMGSFLVMTIIFSKLGFVRLLGLGHVLFWTPLCLWLIQGLQERQFSLDSNLQLWIYAVLIVNGLSLVIDYLDFFRYLRGERAEL